MVHWWCTPPLCQGFAEVESELAFKYVNSSPAEPPLLLGDPLGLVTLAFAPFRRSGHGLENARTHIRWVCVLVKWGKKQY